MNPRWWYCGPPVHPTYLWILLEPELHLGERHVGAEDSFAAAAATARPKQFINYQSLRSITIDYLFGQSLRPPHSFSNCVFYISFIFMNILWTWTATYIPWTDILISCRPVPGGVDSTVARQLEDVPGAPVARGPPPQPVARHLPTVEGCQALRHSKGKHRKLCKL